jgi:hypothetical protein
VRVALRRESKPATGQRTLPGEQSLRPAIHLPMASHERKFYQNEIGQCWWLCCHEDREAFILFEDKPSERRIELQMRDFFDSERSRPAQQALLKLIGSLAVFQD